jgi:hypothetical protein
VQVTDWVPTMHLQVNAAIAQLPSQIREFIFKTLGTEKSKVYLLTGK